MEKEYKDNRVLELTQISALIWQKPTFVFNLEKILFAKIVDN